MQGKILCALVIWWVCSLENGNLNFCKGGILYIGQEIKGYWEIDRRTCGTVISSPYFCLINEGMSAFSLRNTCVMVINGQRYAVIIIPYTNLAN